MMDSIHGPSDPMGVTGQLCNWIHSIKLQDIPEDVKTRVKYLILDGVGCALVGAKLPWSETAVNAVLEMEGSGKCALLGWNKRLPPLAASLLNSTFIQAFELDDVGAEAPWHANSIIIPALLAAAEHVPQRLDGKDPDGERFLLSTIVGFEIGSRVGLALHGPDMLSRGWHSGAVFGPPAAAAAVSKLLGLSPMQTEDAFGTACTQACGLMSAQYESMAKRMQHGFAARNGLFAALVSKNNYTGIDKVFERPYGGYLAAFGQGSNHSPPYDETRLTEGLGHDWRGINGIGVKPYASMLATHGPIDCITAFQASHPEKMADLNSIHRITIEQSSAPFAHGGQEVERPVNALGAQMSTRYCAAVQLVDRVVLMDQYSSVNLDRDILWKLIGKTECLWDKYLDSKGKWATRMTIQFADGYTLVKEIAHPKTVSEPLSNEVIQKKWAMLADTVIDESRKHKIEELILNLEGVKDVRSVIELLLPEVLNPLR